MEYCDQKLHAVIEDAPDDFMQSEWHIICDENEVKGQRGCIDCLAIYSQCFSKGLANLCEQAMSKENPGHLHAFKHKRLAKILCNLSHTLQRI